MKTEDIVTLSDRFWDSHMDGSAAFDMTAATIVTIQCNLCIGTLAPYASKQKNIQLLIPQLEKFEVCGGFMLTEIGHGLDARNIETTATLSEDGKSFDLHTPSSAAAKAMAPSTPLGGIPKIAVVFAQLIVEGKSYGVRTFCVRLTDGKNMCKGVSTILLPQKPGNGAFDHAITTFNHVRLDKEDLLGELGNDEDKRQLFLSQIHRVKVGGLVLSLTNIPATKAAAYLCYSFSKQRKVYNPKTKLPVPILSFPTQYGPIISAAAHAVVMQSGARFFIGAFRAKGLPEMLQQALSCIFKATITYATQQHLTELGDRCGWRGLFAQNKIIEMQLGMRGNSIAEGDVMVLCIRMSLFLSITRFSISDRHYSHRLTPTGLASEFLQSKHTIPSSENPSSLLARYEEGLISSLLAHLAASTSDDTAPHRSDFFAQNVTPRAVELVQAIGRRFIYDATVEDSSVRREFLDVWEADCMLADKGWYVEHAGFTNADLYERRVKAIERALPLLEQTINEWGMEKWFGGVPLVNEELEKEFMAKLPVFESKM